MFGSSKGKRRRRRSSKRGIKVLAAMFMVTIMIVAIFLLFYQQTNTHSADQTESGAQPEKFTPSPEEDPLDLSAEEYERQATLFNEQFKKSSEGQTPDEIAPELIAILDKAIDRQRSLTRLVFGSASQKHREHLENLVRERDEIMGARLSTLSRRMEMEAFTAIEKEDYDTASKLLAEAIGMQERIDREFRQAPQVNPSRVNSLKRMSSGLLSKPFHQRLVAFEEKAADWLKEENWEEARKSLEEAIALQSHINREFPSSAHSSRAKVQQLQAQIRDMQVGATARKIEEVLDRGKAFMKSGDYALAAESFTSALDQQRRLIQQHPTSPAASSARLEEIDALRQTALAQPLSNKAENLGNELMSAISQRQLADIDAKIENYFRAIQELRAQFPRSPLAQSDSFQMASYLNQSKHLIQQLQETALALLQPLDEGRKMASREVSQQLYEQVMRQNPSRQVDPSLPVESLSFPEALEFCQRLSWILGMPVKLPTVADFRKALGSSENNELVLGDIQPLPINQTAPNPQGFAALLGNVREWALPENFTPDWATTLDEAPVFGGSIRDTSEDLGSVPVVNQNTRERNRFTGLRFVVEMTRSGKNPGDS